MSFTIPFPANYGGIIDVFYKIKSFKKAGVQVILHCYQYNRNEAAELQQYCQEVHYYKRNMNPALLISAKPFIVASRQNSKLIHRLAQDQYPILLEGIHCCALMESPALKGRKFLIRNHNIEHHYYRHLAAGEKNLLKKWFFQIESRKLARYEKKIFPLAHQILGISKKDTEYLKKHYKKSTHVSAFHQFESLKFPNSSGKFAFYHGNLAISENNLAALFLVEKVFSQTNYPLIIGGNAPSKELVASCKKNAHITLQANIDSAQIMSLLENAQVNVLPTFQNTGIKLKLLAALFAGKHCLVNTPMVEGTGLEGLCEIQDDPTDFAKRVNELAKKSFSKEQFTQRTKMLDPFKNSHGTNQCVDLL